MNYKNLANWYTELKQRKMNYIQELGQLVYRAQAEEDGLPAWPTGIQSSGRG
jgi:hypothetical protein